MLVECRGIKMQRYQKKSTRKNKEYNNKLVITQKRRKMLCILYVIEPKDPHLILLEFRKNSNKLQAHPDKEQMSPCNKNIISNPVTANSFCQF